MHDETPSIIDDHKFKPKDRWWGLCEHCNLAESAHTETMIIRNNDKTDE